MTISTVDNTTKYTVSLQHIQNLVCNATIYRSQRKAREWRLYLFSAEQHSPKGSTFLQVKNDCYQSPVNEVEADDAERRNADIPATNGAQFPPHAHNCAPGSLSDLFD